MNLQKSAQKGLVVKSNKLLLIKYGKAQYLSDELSGKYALPGGKIDFGETPDNALIREVKEETGIICKPGLCIDFWNWEYMKEDDFIQINAVSRVCSYVEGETIDKSIDKESTIEDILWINFDIVLNMDIVFDERPSIEELLRNKSFYLQSKI